MWVALIILLVIGCGVVGGLAQALVGQPGQSSHGQLGSRSERAFIGGVTAVVAVGVLSQVALLDHVKKLFSPTDTADVFQSLVLVASVAVVAGFLGQTLLYRLAERVLSGFNLRLEDVEEQVAMERKAMEQERKAMEAKVALNRKIRDVDYTITRASIAVGEGHLEVGIQLLKPILSDSEVPQSFLARAHGVIANAKKKSGLLDEALNHVDEAHRLSPNDYRFLFNRACYRWMINDDAIDEVLRDLRQSIEKGLSLDAIERDDDLATLRKHERFRELMVNKTKDGV